MIDKFVILCLEIKGQIFFFAKKKKILLAKHRIFSLRNTKSWGVAELFGKPSVQGLAAKAVMKISLCLSLIERWQRWSGWFVCVDNTLGLEISPVPDPVLGDRWSEGKRTDLLQIYSWFTPLCLSFPTCKIEIIITQATNLESLAKSSSRTPCNRPRITQKCPKRCFTLHSSQSDGWVELPCPFCPSEIAILEIKCLENVSVFLLILFPSYHSQLCLSYSRKKKIKIKNQLL